MRGFMPSTVSGRRNDPALREMDDCDVLTLWTTDQHMVYFMGTRSVAIAIFCYSQQHTLSKVINVAINPLKTI